MRHVRRGHRTSRTAAVSATSCTPGSPLRRRAPHVLPNTRHLDVRDPVHRRVCPPAGARGSQRRGRRPPPPPRRSDRPRPAHAGGSDALGRGDPPVPPGTLRPPWGGPPRPWRAGSDARRRRDRRRADTGFGGRDRQRLRAGPRAAPPDAPGDLGARVVGALRHVAPGPPARPDPARDGVSTARRHPACARSAAPAGQRRSVRVRGRLRRHRGGRDVRVRLGVRSGPTV
jgi:hypothetical protein